MPRKVLVTGGAGFIGSNFIHYLLDRYDDISVINLDDLTYAGNLRNLADLEKDPRYFFIRENICNFPGLQTVFKKFEPDYVINFAAESHVDRSILDPDIFIRSNVLGVQNLLKLSLDCEIERMIQISTDEVYGSLGESGVFTEKSPLDPRSPYSASKASADLLTLAYYYTFNLPVNITRCSNNYGPFQFPEKLIPLTILHCLKGEKIPVYGDGLNIRDWIHVDDHCSAIDRVLTDGIPGEIYNVGAQNEMTNIEMVNTIICALKELRPDLPLTEDSIVFVPDRKGHDRRYAIDPEKIQKTLGWKSRMPVSEGIKTTVEWYLNNVNWLESVINAEYLHYYSVNYRIGNPLPKL
ncbi:MULTISPECIES: dTDP-glucose 4,6-dehydratase [unclassified Methanoregula]|uniref:dTDP-glucose 4,6-dehydratase n=1 Tax=unclassified Methanoregula TaxID=2649730 RepID=UPI0009CE0B18|nr:MULTISPECIES: dTDP-glucose 4,6-dehydratase [unclassified Methanoregula]OPX65125.1 MAG: dTDP-glucose 4,6 dehydratase [Methanoregula sp. PtaB.Bin085]OPY32037.1 MAG: dTDP-glucose 4,6 dehydratase [Methanoregula sp. PtaU1.Bin006]